MATTMSAHRIGPTACGGVLLAAAVAGGKLITAPCVGVLPLTGTLPRAAAGVGTGEDAGVVAGAFAGAGPVVGVAPPAPAPAPAAVLLPPAVVPAPVVAVVAGDWLDGEDPEDDDPEDLSLIHI